MRIPVELQGFGQQKIEYEPPGLFTGGHLLVNGKAAPAGDTPGTLKLKRADGKSSRAMFRPRLLGLDLPDLVVDEQTVTLTEPMSIISAVWSAAPLVLVMVGGLLGGLVGGVATWVNLYIFRTQLNKIVKYALTAGVCLAAALTYAVLYILLLPILRGL